MIEVIPGMPPGVQAFKAVGEVTLADYRQVLEPALQATIAAGRKLRLVLFIGPECTGYTRGAKWEDLKLSLGDLRHLRRGAVVSDYRWVTDSVRSVSWMMPTKVKVFPVSRLAEAMRWVAS